MIEAAAAAAIGTVSLRTGVLLAFQQWGQSYASHAGSNGQDPAYTEARENKTRPPLPNQLNDDFASTGTGIEFDENDLLPRADTQVSTLERDRDRWAEHGRTHVARPVVVAPSEMMLVLTSARREVLP